MDFTVPQHSVRSALGDLQLKVRLLEDERNHFEHMFCVTGRAFEDHRLELNQLLAKERQLAARSEEELRLELQRVLAENASLHAREMEAKQQQSLRIRTAMESFQTEQSVREARLRADVSEAYAELQQLRRVNESLQIERSHLETSLVQDNARHGQLEAELLRIQRDLGQMEQRRSSPGRPCESNVLVDGKGARVRKTFVPGGPVDVWRMTSPATHNIQSIVQTIEKKNLLKPRRHGSPSAQDGGHQLDDVCRALILELVRQREEYNAITAQLLDPRYDTLGASRRLREVMQAIDDKTNQLRALRRQQSRINSENRLQGILDEVFRENRYCEAMHRELQHIIRSA
jgi:hypothetical protein